MKKIIISILSIGAIAIGAEAGGLYFTSGSDFRKPTLKYTLRTTETNQAIVVTPSRVTLLSTY